MGVGDGRLIVEIRRCGAEGGADRLLANCTSMAPAVLHDGFVNGHAANVNFAMKCFHIGDSKRNCGWNTIMKARPIKSAFLPLSQYDKEKIPLLHSKSPFH